MKNINGLDSIFLRCSKTVEINLIVNDIPKGAFMVEKEINLTEVRK